MTTTTFTTFPWVKYAKQWTIYPDGKKYVCPKCKKQMELEGTTTEVNEHDCFFALCKTCKIALKYNYTVTTIFTHEDGTVMDYDKAESEIEWYKWI